MSRPVGLLLAIIAMGVAGWGGCSQPGSPEQNGTVDDDEPHRVACDVDGDCESYYRCMDGYCTEPPAMTGQRDESTPKAEILDGDESLATFYLELAVTQDEQATGLMYRPEMLPDWGMLFIYDDDQHLSFWMKNTLIELDMIFVDSSGEVVGVVERAEPETTTQRSVGRPARYVLEVNGGLAEEYGIEAGTRMRLENVEQRYQPDR